MLPKINIQFRDYEFKSVNEHLLSDGEHETVELVKYNLESYFTIVHWVKGKDGYGVKLVGDRPFEHIRSDDWTTIWKFMETIQDLLDWNLYSESD